jgi:hypothetical protein
LRQKHESTKARKPILKKKQGEAMPKSSKIAVGEAIPDKEDRSEDQLKAAIDINVPIAHSHWGEINFQSSPHSKP